MKWSSAHPGLIVFLLDQSGSMTQPYVNNESRSEFACKALNVLIDDIINRNSSGFKIKDRCHIAVIGYNQVASCLLSGYLSEIEKMDVSEYDDHVPMWIKPTYEDGITNMKAAFEMAYNIVKKWIDTCPDKPAPVIINISDGHPYYDQLDFNECMKQTEAVVEQIKILKMTDGKVSIFNIMIGNGCNVIKFPLNDEACDNAESRFLFNISTIVPESYRKEAESKYGVVCEQGAKGVIYQANDADLVSFIRFGSTMA